MSLTPPGTKESFVYELLKSQILSGELLPGARLVQQEIAAKISVSAIPVREALGRLRMEGLVEHKAHQGVYVARLSKHDLEEILLTRAALETLATRVAVPFMTKQRIKELRRLVEAMRAAIKKKEFHEYGTYNKQFHLKVYDAVPFRRLYQSIVDLWAMADRYRARAIFVLLPDLAEKSVEEHSALVDALERADVEAAGSLMDGHKRFALGRILDRLEGDGAQGVREPETGHHHPSGPHREHRRGSPPPDSRSGP